MILNETVEQALKERNYHLLNETKKKMAFRREGDLPVYLNRSSRGGETTLVLHPEHPIIEAARLIDGLGVSASYYHSSNMSLFPKRMNKGKAPIAFGWGVTFESDRALRQLLNLLEGVASIPTAVVTPPDVRLPLVLGQDIDVMGTRRVGQSEFRLTLLAYWKGCAVTGFTCEPLLRASHILPWMDCTSTQKTDVFNGLLLAPHLDAAFDCGYISFEDDGSILISSSLLGSDASILGLRPNLRLKKVHASHAPYLALHRTKIFQQ